MMDKEKITIEVPRKTAEAYRSAPPEVRQRAERVLTFALLSRRERVEAFRALTQRTSDYAEKQGLTEEKLAALLEELEHEDDE